MIANARRKNHIIGDRSETWPLNTPDMDMFAGDVLEVVVSLLLSSGRKHANCKGVDYEYCCAKVAADITRETATCSFFSRVAGSPLRRTDEHANC